MPKFVRLALIMKRTHHLTIFDTWKTSKSENQERKSSELWRKKEITFISEWTASSSDNFTVSHTFRIFYVFI